MGRRAAHDRRRRARKPEGRPHLRPAPVADRAEGQDRCALGLSHGADERFRDHRPRQERPRFHAADGHRRHRRCGGARHDGADRHHARRRSAPGRAAHARQDPGRHIAQRYRRGGHDQRHAARVQQRPLPHPQPQDRRAHAGARDGHRRADRHGPQGPLPQRAQPARAGGAVLHRARLHGRRGPGRAPHGGGGFRRIPAGDPGPVFLPRRAGADRYRPAAQQSFQFRRARFADRRRDVQTDTGV